MITAGVNYKETPLNIACAAHLLQKNCGSTARRTFLTLTLKINPADPECVSGNFRNLKSAFLEYANLPEDQQDVYQSVLDALVQRRR
ncbi:hypothetical protein NPIL_597611 [Nephila pilipes]|uniref:Uncharacterized protein n=1 Tax=Nephila pilipes TaxID=299642 RepID=A0A8X6TJB1_NEPPI|nr:hypothetical protein NPIL_597611 [Nephila pilipes]